MLQVRFIGSACSYRDNFGVIADWQKLLSHGVSKLFKCFWHFLVKLMIQEPNIKFHVMADNRNFCLRYFLNYSTESKLEIKEFLNLVLLLKVKLGFNRFFWLLQLFAIRNISDDLWCLLHWNWVFKVSFVFTEAKSKPLVAVCGYCSCSVFATHHMVEQHH